MTTSGYLIPYLLTCCAWCVHCDGALGTQPDGPVYPDKCNPWQRVAPMQTAPPAATFASSNARDGLISRNLRPRMIR